MTNTRVAVAILLAVVGLASTGLRAEIIEQILVKVNGEIFTKSDLEQRQVSALRQKGQQIDLKNDSANQQLRKALDEITPQIMRAVSAVIARAATMRAGVLIRGEDGTGRQLAARAIHSAQTGAHGAFVAVNCAAFETEQLDVELFGGAARPQIKDAPGGLERVSRHSRLHEALGGTLYLQNLADAPARVQARLARVLRDREARLVETGEAIGLDVRPMAGVEPGFDASVQDGRVREDLFRRVSTIALDMPPLRNRREDIPALVNYFVRQICASLGVPPKTLSRPALSLISALPWRGNAPEMRALIKNIVVGLQGGRGIGLDEVLLHVKLDAGSVVFANGGTLKEARARFERDYIVAILEQHHGRISDAARALGIQRTNLYRKMRSLRVHRDHRQ